MPGGGAQQQQATGGKKANHKGPSATKQRKADGNGQRRIGCPVLLESGCRVGEPVDPKNPVDAVKMICQNPKCDFSPFIHRRCYDEWENLLVTVMATTSWSRSWTDSQRRSNLWDKKGYQLIGKMCRCLCDKGHVRRDLDYKPPVTEEAATKKKLKKVPANKNLPTLKHPDFKAGFIGKQLPNVAGSTSVNAPSTSGISTSASTVLVNRMARRNIFQSTTLSSQSLQEGYDYQRSSFNASPIPSPTPEKPFSHRNEDDDASENAFGIFQRSRSLPKLGPDSVDENGGEDDDIFGITYEFRNSIIPCVRSLLRWKNTPISLNDATLTEIVNNCSAETLKKMDEAGGLGAALAQTGYFIVGQDSIRLKEIGNQMADPLPMVVRNSVNGGDKIENELSLHLKSDQLDGTTYQSCTSQFSMDQRQQFENGSTFGEDPFANNGRGRGTSGVAVTENNQYSFSSTSSPFPNGSSTDHLATVREGLLAGLRSPSSGFEEESIGSLTSDCDVQMKGETIGTRYFVSQRIPCRESVDSGYLQADSPCEFINRSLQFYGTTAPSPANFIRQFWSSASPLPQSQPLMWYCREYNLFNGPSFEDLFRREMPNLYNGTGRRFEPTNTAPLAVLFSPNALPRFELVNFLD